MTGRRAPRIGFAGVLGSGNLGNDSSLDALLTFLRDRLPDARFDFLVMEPEALRERYGAPATPLQWFEANAHRFPRVPGTALKMLGRVLDPVRTWRWARGHDVVIVPGMGVLETTVPMRPWGFPWGLLGIATGARLAGCRFLLVCVGADVIRRPLTRWLITTAARLAHYRSYRDEHSRAAMRSMGVDVRADRVYPDLSFAHPVPAAAEHRGGVAIGLMDFWGTNDERRDAERFHRNYLEVMTRFALWLVDAGRPITFVTCDPVDTAVIEQVRATLAERRPGPGTELVSAPATPTIQDLMAVLATVDAVVATRYHNVVTAVQLARPTISVGYADKHREVMARAGVPEFCQDARSVELDLLVRQFTELQVRAAELVPVMAEAHRAVVAEVEQQLAELAALLDGGGSVPADPAGPTSGRGVVAGRPR